MFTSGVIGRSIRTMCNEDKARDRELNAYLDTTVWPEGWECENCGEYYKEEYSQDQIPSFPYHHYLYQSFHGEVQIPFCILYRGAILHILNRLYF